MIYRVIETTETHGGIRTASGELSSNDIKEKINC